MGISQQYNGLANERRFEVQLVTQNRPPDSAWYSNFV